MIQFSTDRDISIFTVNLRDSIIMIRADFQQGMESVS